MKKLAILGSTGNVGTQTLDVVDKYPDKFQVIALSAGNNIGLLKKQIEKYKPLAAAVANAESAQELEKQVNIPIYSGQDASLRIAEMAEYDTLINALVSLSGIKATLKGIEKGKDIALANKETLVSAGEIVMREVKKNQVKLMPIDSEHSALFQCLNGENLKEVHKLIVTCSGGALRDKTKEELKNTSLEDALGHKTWNMGKKITIDSATLMNKGFEVIEAMWLYDMPIEKIDVVIHPESIIHSMVEYTDASVIAQLSSPDMRLPIQYALSYPERWEAAIPRLDFSKNLTFQKPDMDRFPCLAYALEAAKKLGTLPAAMNAANDFMVEQFLTGKCQYLDIQEIIRKVMDAHKTKEHPGLSDIENVIKESRAMAEKFLREK